MLDKNVMTIKEGKFFIKELHGDLGTDFLMVLPYNCYVLGNVEEVRIGAFYGRFNSGDKLTFFRYLGDKKISDEELQNTEIQLSVENISEYLKILTDEKYKKEPETKELFNISPQLFDNNFDWEEHSVVSSLPFYDYYSEFFNKVELGIKQKTLKDFLSQCRKFHTDLMKQFAN